MQHFFTKGIRSGLVIVAMASFSMMPLAYSTAQTNTFSDETSGHSNEILQQETNIEHNDESVLVEKEPVEVVQPAEAVVGELDDSTAANNPTVSEVLEQVEDTPAQPASTQPASPASTEPTPAVVSTETAPAPPTGTASVDETTTSGGDMLCFSPGEEVAAANAQSMECYQQNSVVAESAPSSTDGQNEEGDVDAEETVEADVEIENTNDADVVNDTAVEALTGENEVVAEEDIEETAMETGDVNVYANVLNIVNTNMYNSEIVEVVENFNNLASDVYMNSLETSPMDRSQSLVSGLCDGDVSCQSFATFKLSNTNTANVENNVAVSGNSGDNTMTGFEVEDSSISTGDVNALVNVLNIVNTNMLNSRWTIASFNVFGDWSGDLVMPSQMYFRDAMAIGTDLDPDVSISEIQKVLVDINQQGTADIQNNVTTTAETGANGIVATGTEPDANGETEGGDVEESTIEAGTAETVTAVHNTTNTTLYNGMWFLGMVNTLGDWTGDVYALPEQVAMADSEYGLTFFATSEQSPEMAAQFALALESAEAGCTDTCDPGGGQDNSTDETSVGIVEVGIDNTNDATIVNNIDVSANTGNNVIAATEVERSRITTGNARVLANILNFANTNLINADLYIGLTNIFGAWNGNIVFGYPDLDVTQTLQQGDFPSRKDNRVNYSVDFANGAGTMMRNANVEWQYDTGMMRLDAVQSPYSYTEISPGILSFAVGDLASQANGNIQLQLLTNANLNIGDNISTLARISGTGPERNMNNNQFVLNSLVGNNILSVPSISNSGTGQSGGASHKSAAKDLNQSSGLAITKTNNASGSLAVGDTVTFQITVENTGSSSLENVIVYDTLSMPDGTVINSQDFKLGTMTKGKSATIEYDVGISKEVPGGTYTNTAYAQGFDGNLKQVKSVTAKSSFRVGDVVLEKLEGLPLIEPVIINDNQLPQLFGGENNPRVLGDVDNSRSSNRRVSGGILALASSDSDDGQGTGSGGARQAASELDLFPKATAQSSKPKSYGLLATPIVSTALMSLLIGLGYAIASYREKKRTAKFQEE